MYIYCDLNRRVTRQFSRLNLMSFTSLLGGRGAGHTMNLEQLS